MKKIRFNKHLYYIFLLIHFKTYVLFTTVFFIFIYIIKRISYEHNIIKPPKNYNIYTYMLRHSL